MGFAKTVHDFGVLLMCGSCFLAIVPILVISAFVRSRPRTGQPPLSAEVENNQAKTGGRAYGVFHLAVLLFCFGLLFWQLGRALLYNVVSTPR